VAPTGVGTLDDPYEKNLAAVWFNPSADPAL
jgi:hypothetical protein